MEFKAKTVEEAVSIGLAETGLSEDQAQIEIKEQPTKGLFGRLKGQAVVEITKKPEPEIKEEKDNGEGIQKAKELVCTVLDFLNIEAEAEVSEGEDRSVITLSANKSSVLIGHRGEVLDALQALAGAMANIGKKEYKKVVVDCENYRDKREDALIALAHKLEQKATEMRREVVLEPMSPFERRIIHTALAESETVTTSSSGKEPNRYVVIIPNDKDEFSKPYNAGRNTDRKRYSQSNRSYNKNERRYSDREKPARRTSSSKKSAKISFGTYLGNSLKEKEEK